MLWLAVYTWMAKPSLEPLLPGKGGVWSVCVRQRVGMQMWCGVVRVCEKGVGGGGSEA
jgi:hypothetical protein